MKVYLVGGCVRDALLGLPVSDRDWVVVGETEQSMLDAGYQKIGQDFPVFLHPKTKEEYALARVERKVAKGYQGFACDAQPTITLEEDLERRDLTINAIAQQESGELIDPFGGQQDLEKKILRHVSKAFSEDPVRILRIARFAARYAYLGFTIAPETLELMKTMVKSGEVDALVPERVWREMERALSEKNPDIFIETLRECGALAKIFPALNVLWGVPQTEKWHPEIDAGIHTILALKQAVLYTPKTEIRFAVLCHDLGKGITPKSEWPSHKGHESAGLPLLEAWCAQYHIPNQYKKLASQVMKWHLHAHKIMELKPTTILRLFKGLDAFRQPQNVEDFAIACHADASGRKDLQDKPYPQKAIILEIHKLLLQISTQPLLEKGLEGKKLGEALEKERVKVIKDFMDLNKSD